MLKPFFYFALTIFTVPNTAFAGFDDLFKTHVLCEHYLSGIRAKHATIELKKQVLGRPFTFASINRVKKQALKVLKLDSIDPTNYDRLIISLIGGENELLPMTLRLQLFSSGNLAKVYRHNFPDDTPTFWQSLRLDDDELELTHDELSKKYLVPKSPGVDEGHLGFITDPDVNGVRAYVTSRHYSGELGTISLELGLDVPCNRLESYVDPELETATQLLTNATIYCRVPILFFSRPIAMEEED